ncbi:MAG: transcription initiation factor IIB family protein [Crenarchaeota archaeon]|nr:transcription initiation factor IIB family protein [Thermoproteota archaeon]
MYCPYCGSRNVILDPERGEYVCTNCGTVIDVEYVPSVSQLQNEPLTSVSDEVGIVPNVQDLVKKELGKIRMMKLRKLDFDVRSRLRVEKRAISCLKAVARKLGLGERQIELALQILRRLLRKYGTDLGSRDISSYKLAAAAVLYVVLMHNLPVSPREIAEEFQKLGHKVSTSDMLDIVSSSGVALVRGLSERVKSYVGYIISRLNIPDVEKMKISREVATILEDLPLRKLQGKSPKTLAAALVVIASRRVKSPITIVDVASVLNVSPVTLREHVRRIEKMIRGKVQ